MSKNPTKERRGVTAASRTGGAWVAGTDLPLMAIVAPIAQFGVLESLVVPENASATVDNVIAFPTAVPTSSPTSAQTRDTSEPLSHIT